MVELKLIPFAAVVALWIIVTSLTNKADSHTSKVEMSKTKIMPFWPQCCEKRSRFCLKSFVPSSRAEVSVCENFHPGYRGLGRKNRDLDNRASPASHMNTSKFLRRKKWRGKISQTEAARLSRFI